MPAIPALHHRTYTPGREVKDNNGDGVFDESDVCTKDLSEPYIDANDNGMYDLGEKYIDANNNGQFDEADGSVKKTP